MFNYNHFQKIAKMLDSPAGPMPNSGPGGKKRKRIKDRGINWKEVYTGKAEGLKERMDKRIGKNSYFRWEGHDYTTNGDYFVVVGPSITKDNHKRFFSGIKRLPKDSKSKIFAASGKYFFSIYSALSYASTKWGIQFPKNTPNYTADNLLNVKIPRHLRG